MGRNRRGADGRRHFATELKKVQVDHGLGDEIMRAALVRELDVSPSVVRTWKRLFAHGSGGGAGVTPLAGHERTWPTLRRRALSFGGNVQHWHFSDLAFVGTVQSKRIRCCFSAAPATL